MNWRAAKHRRRRELSLVTTCVSPFLGTAVSSTMRGYVVSEGAQAPQSKARQSVSAPLPEVCVRLMLYYWQQAKQINFWRIFRSGVPRAVDRPRKRYD